MKDLKVTRTYTSQKGDVTVYCSNNGTEIILFLGKLVDAEGKAVVGSDFEGKTLDAKGIVDKFNDKYQIHVTGVSDITVH